MPIAPYAKAYAALIGSVCTALLGTFAADTVIGKVLTVVSVVATAVATFTVENKPTPTAHTARIKLRNEDGAVSLATVALVAIAVVLVLAFFGVRGHLG